MATSFSLSAYDTAGAPYENAALGDDGLIAGALAHYLRSVAEPNCFLNYEMVPLASQAVVPAGQGKYMTIPNFVNDSTYGVANATVVTNEALPFNASGTATASIAGLRETRVENIDREQTYFRDGYIVSKLYKNTATVQGEYERIAQFIMKGSAQTQEKLLQNNMIYQAGAAALTDPAGGGAIWVGAVGGAVTSGKVAGAGQPRGKRSD